jgi:hypothetical protein
MQRLENIEEALNGEYADCYVSTDMGEIKKLLQQLGYGPAKNRDMAFVDFYNTTPYCCAFTMQHPKGVTIEGADIPLDEALQRKDDIGFMAMAKLRIYLDNRTSQNECIDLLKALGTERQNAAFIDSSYRAAFVRLSEFY